MTRTRLPGDAPAVNVHRLVQKVMQVRLAAKAIASALEAAAVTLIADAFPTGDLSIPMDVRSWPRCRLLEPHAVAVLVYAPDEGDAAEKTGQLLNQYALHLMARADYAAGGAALSPLDRRLRGLAGAWAPEWSPLASTIWQQLLQDTDRWRGGEVTHAPRACHRREKLRPRPPECRHSSQQSGNGFCERRTSSGRPSRSSGDLPLPRLNQLKGWSGVGSAPP